MTRRLAWLDPWQEHAVAAVTDGCASPTDVVRWIAVNVHQIAGWNVAAYECDDPLSMSRRFVIQALERAEQDGQITWPRSPSGAHIEGGLRPA